MVNQTIEISHGREGQVKDIVTLEPIRIGKLNSINYLHDI